MDEFKTNSSCADYIANDHKEGEDKYDSSKDWGNRGLYFPSPDPRHPGESWYPTSCHTANNSVGIQWATWCGEATIEE